MMCGWRSLRNVQKCNTPACVAESWIRWPPVWLIPNKRFFSIRERCSVAWFRFRRKSAVLVLDSGIKRSLASSSFNQRRAECEEAAKQLGVRALRDIDVNELVES